MSWPIAKVPVLPEPAAPGKIVWAFLLVLIMASAALPGIYFWPAGKPTGAVFWLAIFVLPFLIWAALLLLRLLRHDRHKAAVQVWNEEQAKNTKHWDEWSARHLAVLDQHVLLPGEIALDDIFASSDQSPFNPGRALYFSGSDESLPTRRTALLRELMIPLVANMDQSGLPIMIHMQCVEDNLPVDCADEIRLILTEMACPEFAFAIHPLSPEQIDAWIDEPKAAVHILVTYQLNSEGEDYYTEAAAAFILAPDSPEWPALAYLLRPVQSDLSAINEDIPVMAQSQPLKDCSHIWISGLTVPLNNALIKVIQQNLPEDAGLTPLSLDNALGKPGPVFNWLALLAPVQAADFPFHHLCALAGPNTDCFTLVMVSSSPVAVNTL